MIQFILMIVTQATYCPQFINNTYYDLPKLYRPNDYEFNDENKYYFNFKGPTTKKCSSTLNNKTYILPAILIN